MRRDVNVHTLVMLAFSLIVLSLVPGLCTSCGTSRPGPIGMMVRLYGADAASVAREFDLLTAMHVTWVRVDFEWPTIEGNHGKFDWAYTDAVVKEASARRLNVLGILSHTPAWARPASTTTSNPPDHVSDFAEFARATVARYSPLGVHTWEIWNEPNVSAFWQPAPDANRYGELFRAAATTMRAVDPVATLLIGGLTSGGDLADGSRISQAKYVEQLYGNGTAQAADAIAVHPYSFAWPHAHAVIGGLDDVPALHQIMERHGDGGKNVWITEFGVPTGTASDAVSDKDQAATIMHARKLVQKWSWTGPLIYYELRDGGTNPAIDEENFGVVRKDLSLKPAGEALIQQQIAS